MQHSLTFLNWLLPLVQLALLIQYGASFFLRAKVHQRNRWLLPAIGVHALFLVLRGIHLGHPPLQNSYDILCFVALAVTVAYCVVEYAVRDRRTGMFVFLVVFLFQHTASVFLAPSAGGATPSAAEGFSWARLHSVPAIMAYTGFTLAAVYGALHLVSRRDLKQHRIGVLFERLPPLELLGRMTWYALVFGFVFITVAIASGPFLFGADGGTAASMWDPKVSIKIFVGSAAWLIYGVAVAGRLAGRWSPGRVARIAVGGFAAIMVVLVGSVLLS